MLELHCHTTHSDGTLTPPQLVDAAAVAGVEILAITDHDTMSGWEEATAAARTYNIEIVPGLELSTVHSNRSMHILGFYPNRERLETPLQSRLAGRHRRAQQMLDKLAELGYPVELANLNGSMAPGRPHIATALVRAGYVQSPQEAFERWLGDDKPAYVQYEKFSAVEGIQLLRQCQAVPVWAHPFLFRGGDVEAILPELVAAGLLGIEVYHPSHTPSQSRKLEALCQRYGLLMTGGSDYHGPSKQDDRHSGLNQLHLPTALLPPLQQAAQQLQSQN
ncbi:PHP domain-containing protein [Leptolyngbya sp. NK1-12]|uniref:PHP domain-containing protein n=1 Tax=Leptolyngbya sp. NK1-12 TaxID=2547451 RepID=A0AA96WIF9_9CYAN|nr:PHP domain-containing protein [Leptolyngbya sp. NK1-12]WNZ25265.1 PHP domain-containing protein [Leptolyngbya sp. NK1-12]